MDTNTPLTPADAKLRVLARALKENSQKGKSLRSESEALIRDTLLDSRMAPFVKGSRFLVEPIYYGDADKRIVAVDVAQKILRIVIGNENDRTLKTEYVSGVADDYIQKIMEDVLKAWAIVVPEVAV